ncbi:MAG: hypothetical protein S0880_33860 [Actinomycetota bacterium]|nr:hypothetical protein [Actinomycetota bacterium]
MRAGHRAVGGGLAAIGLVLAGTAVASAGTEVPGHKGRSGDVNGHYTSLYAYDASGSFYWDLGDGRVRATPGVDGVDDLDEATLTECDYQVNYRGDFGGDPFLNSGWIMNQIHCSGVDDGNYSYLIVHESDPRYTGDPEWAVWGNWEYHVYGERGVGNLARPDHHV